MLLRLRYTYSYREIGTGSKLGEMGVLVVSTMLFYETMRGDRRRLDGLAVISLSVITIMLQAVREY